jgi:hypothetical protein
MVRTSAVGQPNADAGMIAAISAAVTAALGASGLWLANHLVGKAAVQTALNNGFSGLVKDLQHERIALQQTVSDLKAQLTARDIESADLRGEIRQLHQLLESSGLIVRHSGPDYKDIKAIGD